MIGLQEFNKLMPSEWAKNQIDKFNDNQSFEAIFSLTSRLYMRTLFPVWYDLKNLKKVVKRKSLIYFQI